MHYHKIVLAGGSGFLGNVLIEHFKSNTDRIVVFGRGIDFEEGNVRFVHWNAKTGGQWEKELEGADMLVNLAGKSVNCRYTESNKKEILNSRLDATNILGQAVSRCKIPPKLWVQCASATIYRHAEDRPMTEAKGEIGDGFSVDVCQQWEKSFWDQQIPETRKVLLRVAIVFGNDGGVFPRLKNLARIGLGGKQGNGTQMVSWIHEKDFARTVEWSLDNTQASGTYNCSAPEVINNKDAMAVIREKMHVSFGLNSPKWMLEIGARFVGTETELILKSRWVVPEKLLNEGFKFEYPEFEKAVEELVES